MPTLTQTDPSPFFCVVHSSLPRHLIASAGMPPAGVEFFAHLMQALHSSLCTTQSSRWHLWLINTLTNVVFMIVTPYLGEQ